MTDQSGARSFLASAWIFRVRQIARVLWVRAALFCLLGVVTALFSIVLAPYVPGDLALHIGGEAVDKVLTVIASSMLAVTTFSLSTMVTAYASASEGASPRASLLLSEDQHAHTALSTFIGAFLFSVVGIVALSSGLYGSEGRVIMFAVTVLVLAAVVATLIRWIDALSKLGRIRQTISRVERATAKAIDGRAAAPHLGGRPMGTVPRNATPVLATEVGYVQHIDIGALSGAAEETGIWLAVEPGSFVHTAMPLVHVEGPVDDETRAKLIKAFVIGDNRTFEQDVRFGLIVLTEIAQRALSPAVNDPGTAIDVLSVHVRLLTRWQHGCAAAEPELRWPNIHVAALKADDLLDDAFGPIGRDGGGNLEVSIRFQKALAALADLNVPDLEAAARHQSQRALVRAQMALSTDEEKKELGALARAVGKPPRRKPART